MPDGTTTLVVIAFLATAIERSIEAVTNPIYDGLKGRKFGLGFDAGELFKRFTGVVLGLGAGFALAFGLNLNLFSPLLGDGGLSPEQAKTFTALLLGGGSAPAHELIRYIEEKKKKAQGEAAKARL